jgi:haloalkane dehalogenase
MKKIIVFLAFLTLLFACHHEKEVVSMEPIVVDSIDIIVPIDTVTLDTTPINLSDTVGFSAAFGYILRTPESRFDSLKDYNFEPKYVFLDDTLLRMHYIDEGNPNGKIIFLAHGNPSWVYNFRKIVPLLVNAGFRVIAPDMIGFGRSDKPANRSVHTYDNQVLWMEKFIGKLNLTNINIHVQDWGGLVGLRVAIRNQDKFSKIAVSNTTLPDGTNVTLAFKAWRNSSQTVATYGEVMESATFRELSLEEETAFNAPFPEERFKAGPRELPLRVPIDVNDPEAIENKDYFDQYRLWNIPILTIFSEEDRISPNEEEKIKLFPGAIGLPHAILNDASHFIREDKPDEMATHLIAFFN